MPGTPPSFADRPSGTDVLADMLRAVRLTGAVFLGFAVRVYRSREDAAGERAARDLFAYSILYLFLLFAVLLVEVTSGLGTGVLS